MRWKEKGLSSSFILIASRLTHGPSEYIPSPLPYSASDGNPTKHTPAHKPPPPSKKREGGGRRGEVPDGRHRFSVFLLPPLLLLLLPSPPPAPSISCKTCTDESWSRSRSNYSLENHFFPPPIPSTIRGRDFHATLFIAKRPLYKSPFSPPPPAI